MAGNVLLFLYNGGYGEDVASCLLKEVPKAWMETQAEQELWVSVCIYG